MRSLGLAVRKTRRRYAYPWDVVRRAAGNQPKGNSLWREARSVSIQVGMPRGPQTIQDFRLALSAAKVAGNKQLFDSFLAQARAKGFYTFELGSKFTTWTMTPRRKNKNDFVVVSAAPAGTTAASRRAARKRKLPKPGPLGKKNVGTLVGNSLVHAGLVQKAVGCLCPDPDAPESMSLYPDGGGKRVGYVTRTYANAFTVENSEAPGAFLGAGAIIISPSLEKQYAVAAKMDSDYQVTEWKPPVADVNYSSYSGSWDRIRMTCCCVYLEFTGSTIENEGDVTIFTVSEAFHASAPPIGAATRPSTIGLQTLKVPVKDCSGMFVLKPFNPVEARKFEQIVTGEADGWGSLIIHFSNVHHSTTATQGIPVRIRIVQFWEATPDPNTVFASMANHSTHQPALMAAMDDARNAAPSFFPGPPQRAMRDAHQHHHKSILARLKGGALGAAAGFASSGGSPLAALIGGVKGLVM